MKRKKLLSILMALFMILTNVLNPQLIQTIFAETEEDPTEEVQETDKSKSEEADKEDEESEEEDDKSSEADVNTDNTDDDDTDGDVEQNEDEKEKDNKKENEETSTEETPKSEDKEDEDNKDPPAEEEKIQTFANENPKDLGDIFTDVRLYQDKEEIDENTTIEIEDGTELGMEFDWEIADNTDLIADDYATIDIPDAFDTEKIPKGNLEDEDGTIVGTFTFEDSQLKVVFNDELTDKENRKGSVGFNIEFDLSEFDDEVEKEINFGEPFNKIFKVKAKVDGEDIEKSGELEEGANPKSIDWSIDVNTNLALLENGKIVDKTPEGLELKEDSFKVYELEVNRKGEVIDKKETDKEVSFTENGFELDLGKTDKAYRIAYSTNIVDYGVEEYKNIAILTDRDGEKARDDDTIGKIERESIIEKKGEINKNPKTVTWTIDVNKAEELLINAQILDDIPEGLELKDITIYDLSYDGGKWNQGEEADFDGDLDEFPLNLGDIDSAYQIVVKTDIDFDKIDSIDEIKNGIEFTNKTTLKADNLDENESDQDTVKAKWDDLVKKSGKDITSYGDREMEWTVTLNKAQLKINGAKFIDVIGEGHELIENSIKVDGENAFNVKFNNFNDWNLTLPDDLKDEDITFGIDFGTLENEVTISYKTKITDTSVKNYTNRALLFGWLGEGDGPGEGDGNLPYLEDHKSEGKISVNNSYTKSTNGINYKDKTMSWKIVADAKATEIKSLKLTDLFEPEHSMLFLKDTIKIKVGGEELKQNDDFVLTEKGVDGFELKFIGDHQPLKRAKYEITFDTSFDPETVLAAEGGKLNSGRKYTNTVNFDGETEEGKIKEEDKASNNLHSWIGKKGKKKGTLYREDRKISWEIFTNPLGQNLKGEEFKVEDTLTKGQVFDKDSFKVYEYTLNKNGTVNKGDEIGSGFNLEETEEGFTVTFADGIDKPVMFEFDSDIEGISEEKYKNTAKVTGKDLEQNYDDTVKYKDYDKFVDKNSDIDGNTAYTDNEINWEVTVNDSLSDITNAVFKDEISAGQILINDSIKVDGEEVDEDDLTIDSSEDGTIFTIELGNIDSTHKITYTTVVTASDGSVSNKASLTGSDKDLGDSSDKEYNAKSSSWGTGSGDERKGSLEITKVDEDEETITLPAEFELYYELNGEKQIVTGEKQTTEDGKIQYGNLPFRTYYLKETNAPIGYEILSKAPGDYELNEDGYIEIEVNKDNKEIKLDIENIKKKIEVSGKKKWDDVDDRYRPESIEVQLLANDEEKETIEISEKEEWKYEFTDLDEFDDQGKEIEYAVKELNVPKGYKAEIDDYVITNTQEKTEVTGKKVWDEVDDNFRPDSIEVQLLANGEEEDTVKVSNEEDWKYEFTDLAKYDQDGEEIDYTVKEIDVPKGYESKVDNYDIINTQKLTEKSGRKIWKDAENLDGKRPSKITVNLLQNGKIYKTEKISEKDDWAYNFTQLPKYDKEGRELGYTIDEEPVEGYEKSLEGNDLINTRVGETEVSGEKIWQDADNVDESRPEKIKVNLLQNGKLYGAQTVTAKNDWTYSFNHLPKYDSEGREWGYTIDEEPVKGYEKSLEGDDLINTRVGEIEVSGEKIWKDADNIDSTRPDSITVNLLRNGEIHDVQTVTKEDDWAYSFNHLPKYDEEGLEWGYTIDEESVEGYEKSLEDNDLINTRVGETEVSGEKIWQDADNVDESRPDSIIVNLLRNGKIHDVQTVTEEDDWTYSFTHLPKYDSKGREWGYTIDEESVEGYEKSLEGNDLINTRVGETEVSGEKIWQDADNVDESRPDSITVNLLRNGEIHDIQTVTEEEDWAYSFTHLPKYDSKGREWGYTIDEESVEGYEKSLDGDDLINTRVGETEVSGTKIWKDGDSEDRPEEITVNLLQNGEIHDVQTVTAEDDWAYSFTHLPKYDSKGREWGYTIDEEPVEGYAKSLEGNDLVNTRIGHTEITITKSWQDDEDKTGDRPDSIKVNLWQNGELYTVEEIQANEDWEHTFSYLPKYDSEGELNEYTITEHDVPGYETSIDGFDITNTRSDEKSIEITKSWLDDNSKSRPESIEVELFRSIGEKDKESIGVYEVTSENDWILTVDDLAAFDSNGKAYVYEIEEKEVTGYKSEISGFDIVNTRQGTTTIDVQKKWDDSNSNNRPNSITINLYQNGKKISSNKLTEQADWKYTFVDLPQFDENGKVYEYTIEEVEVDGYTSEITGDMAKGFTVTNTEIPDEPEEPEKPEDSEKDEEKDNDSELPKTGETTFVWLAISLILIGLGVAFVREVRKEE